MAKAESSWSGMRKYLEQEMAAPCLRGRVRYNCTAYVGMDGCRIFEVFIDGRLFKQFSLETVNSWFIRMGFTQKPERMSIRDYWDGFWTLMDAHPMDAREEYTDGEFCRALEEYRNSGIETSLHSPDSIVKMFALLDRRCGSRSLAQMGEELASAPEWLKAVYRFRTSCAQGGAPARPD